MTVEQVLFYFLAGGTVLGALAVVTRPFGRNPLHAALALLATLFCVAVLFVTLSAHLVGVLQVLVYAGAVMVLFVFVVMLLNLGRSDTDRAGVTPWQVFGMAAIGVFVVKVGLAVMAATEGAVPVDLAADKYLEFGGIRDVGMELVTTYLFPFEFASVLLLVAVVGAFAIARREGGAA